MIVMFRNGPRVEVSNKKKSRVTSNFYGILLTLTLVKMHLRSFEIFVQGALDNYVADVIW